MIYGCIEHAVCMYIYIYMWTYVFHYCGPHHVYIMWAELGHSHFSLGKCSVPEFRVSHFSKLM